MSRFLKTLWLLVVLLASLPAHANAPLKIYFFQVGQGDSELIISPTGKTILIDGGLPPAGKILKARLPQLVKGPLDLVILTHPHNDHLGGLKEAMQSVGGAKLFMDSGFDFPGKHYEALLDYLKQNNIPVKNAEAGRTIDIGGGASLAILFPYQPFLKGTRSDPNANSVVTRLTYGKRHVYFAGDSEAETEQAVMAKNSDISSDVYKVAHHCSKYSTTPPLLAAIHPSIAVIETGQPNDYGHPTPECMNALKAAGVKYYRTDQDGEVRVITDGEGLNVFNGPESASEAVGSGGTAAPAATGSTSAPTPAPTSANTNTAPAPAPTPAPKPAPSGEGYVASSRAKVFHKASCPAVKKIKEDNRVNYATRDQAVAAGLEPAKDCNP
jgi:beta-lactamase superfamily II metal-dependent hydrolase